MTRWLGIALLPRTEDLLTAIRIQSDLSHEHLLQPALSCDGCLPHVTLFQGPFVEALDIKQVLSDITHSLVLPDLLCLDFQLIEYRPVGWLFLTLSRPALLEQLQEAAIATLTPYLDRSALRSSTDDLHCTEAERASSKAHGYRYTGMAFRPHITLGRTSEETALDLVQHASERVTTPPTWTFDRLSLYAMGKDGAHSAILAEIPFADVRRRAARPTSAPDG
ncbi:hypothetical protein SRB5_45700 [Streptomyces sp. RB5]|uniref:Uncharacterized protein n=1 Tax=Streptomyces smaragdinus TaxID=2585196 RepID=A0A7K0CMB3_9ACTN|nr:2'-5' RNA ligase family protein [Streptomyces smaragdinus]MQY14403.1 hypothetical protein [Streptomyces smaragdinus]